MCTINGYCTRGLHNHGTENIPRIFPINHPIFRLIDQFKKKKKKRSLERKLIVRDRSVKLLLIVP